jgi:NAD(P)H dehydrogenase (quinone)
MPTVLVVYHSRTGNTEKMARAIYEGVLSTGINAILKSFDKVTNDDFVNADAILLGSPTYFRLVSAELKKVVDESVQIYGQLKGKKGGMFTSAGTKADGEKALKSIYEILDCHGIKVIGKGVLSIEEPSKDVLKKCTQYGIEVARSVK